jgi:hypothetical protein
LAASSKQRATGEKEPAASGSFNATTSASTSCLSSPSAAKADDVDSLTRELERLRIQLADLQRSTTSANYTQFTEEEQPVRGTTPGLIACDAYTQQGVLKGDIYATKRGSEIQPDTEPRPLRRRPNNLQDIAVDPRAVPAPPPTQRPTVNPPPQRPVNNAPPTPAPVPPRREPAAGQPIDLTRLPPLPERPAYRRTTATQAVPTEQFSR